LREAYFEELDGPAANLESAIGAIIRRILEGRTQSP